MEEETALVTEDRWMKEGGQLDATDQEMLRELSQNGRLRVRVINIREMLEALKKEEPKKFKSFHKQVERQAGIPLTFEGLIKFGQLADERMQEFTGLVKGMTLGQAAQVRQWRVDGRMTWRSVARAAYLEGWSHQGWGPPENQLMGMALSERAAQFFGENFREPPWN